jgi:formate dehydrogenase major subunit
VTERIRPLRVEGRIIHQVGLPYHWGYGGNDVGDSTNDLGVISGDPNVSIQESKAFTCDVRAGRRASTTTARLAGALGREIRIGANTDDPIAENPKEATE